jgi:hypothetical protein
MVILPNQRVIVVATPRTGSRAIKEAILSGDSHASATKYHHPMPDEVRKVMERDDYAVWTMIREPLSQLKSWISHNERWKDSNTILDFIKNYDSKYFFRNGGMNIYNQEVDRYFIFEQGGHQKMLDELWINEKVPVIGATGSAQRELTEAQENAARSRFAFDFKLYQQVLEGVEPHEQGY